MILKTSTHTIIEPTDIRESLLADILGGVPHNVAGVPPLSPGDNATVNNINGYRHYLHYLACELFNIRRYPGAPERYFSGSATEFYEALKPEHYEQSLTELKRLYEYTQNYLNSEYFKNKFSEFIPRDGYIYAKRGISGRYAKKIDSLFNHAKDVGTPFIEFPTDIISFYAINRAYARDLRFELEIAFEDILIYDEAVILGNKRNPYRERELIALNRRADGLIRVNVDKICSHKQFIEDDNSPQTYSSLYIPDCYVEVIEEKMYPPVRILQHILERIRGLFPTLLFMCMCVLIYIIRSQNT